MAIGGKVIKGDSAPDPGAEAAPRVLSRPVRAGVVNAEDFEARQSASAVVQDAHRKAEQIVAEAERSRDKVFAEAREAGRQEGLASVTEVLIKAKIARDEMVAGAEGEIVGLACRVAEKIIGRDLERAPEVIAEICATVIESAKNATNVTLRVHPRHAQVLRANLPRLMDLVGASKVVSVKEDSDVTGDGCILETPFGKLDAQLSTQFMLLRQLLMPDTAKKEGPK